MLLLDVRNQIFQLFTKFEILSEKNFAEISTPIHDQTENTEGFKHGLILAALKELENRGVVAKIEASKKEVYWVLTNPLSLYDQILEIPGPEAVYIAGVINETQEMLGRDGIVDSTSLRLDDIIWVCDQLHTLFKASREKIEQMRQEGQDGSA